MTSYSRATVLSLSLLAPSACRGREVTAVRQWPSDRPSPDSVAHALATVVGAAPTMLASCGPHHVLIAYVDAPVDLRPESRPGADGKAEVLISLAQRSRHAVAGVIAVAFWSSMPLGVYDTATVRLTRTQHFPPGYSDRNDFTVAPLIEGISVLAHPVRGPAEACAQVM